MNLIFFGFPPFHIQWLMWHAIDINSQRFLRRSHSIVFIAPFSFSVDAGVTCGRGRPGAQGLYWHREWRCGGGAFVRRSGLEIMSRFIFHPLQSHIHSARDTRWQQGSRVTTTKRRHNWSEDFRKDYEPAPARFALDFVEWSDGGLLFCKLLLPKVNLNPIWIQPQRFGFFFVPFLDYLLIRPSEHVDIFTRFLPQGFAHEK